MQTTRFQIPRPTECIDRTPLRDAAHRPRWFIVTALALAAAQAAAQSASGVSTAPRPTPALPDVVITGNPLRSSVFAAPASVLSGDELVRRRAGTLGETLEALPGVAQTAFGPNASRPTIRGLDGERVRVLSNGGGSLDASTLSFDHAVPIDPLVVERLEVLRGPAALLYGGSAIGGVVQALDNRVPRRAITGLQGAAEVRGGGADGLRSGAALLDAGNGQWAVHVDAFGRETSDLRVPSFTPRRGDGSDAGAGAATRVANSAGRAQGASLGASATSATGYLGLAADTYDSRYGIVVEPDVFIRMRREHLAVAGEQRELAGFWRAVRGSWNHTRYQHEEVEGTGEVGTTFRNRGDEWRFEAEHAPLLGWRGVVGVQGERFDFSALGEEAFVPSTQTTRQALFVVQERSHAWGTTRAGLRLERARVRSDGDAPGTDPAEARFGDPAERSFAPRSASLEHVLPLMKDGSNGLDLQASLAHTERAPTAFELYANGLHAATAAFERGDPTLGVERGRNLELALSGRFDGLQLRAGVWWSRFARYVALDATGATIDVPNEEGGVDPIPEFLFRAVPARLNGGELEGSWQTQQGAWSLKFTGSLDTVRSTNTDTGQPLPRLPPWRGAVAVQATQGPWSLRTELRHAAAQNRVEAVDTTTPGYTLLNLQASWRMPLGGGAGAAGAGREVLWFASLNNATDALAFNAATVSTARGLSPLAGRSWRVGARVEF